MASGPLYKTGMPSLEYEGRYAPRIVCGVDEAGRGPLAGPVIAAAVILPPHAEIPQTLTDSKRVARLERERLFDWLTQHACVAIGEATVEEIDRLNILQATLLAMQRAVTSLTQTPQVALIDGNRMPKLSCETITIVKGDSISFSIAAASIIAKVTRDRIMEQMHTAYPEYGFGKHVGYGTKAHCDALRTHGPSPIHRRSFAPVRALLEAA